MAIKWMAGHETARNWTTGVDEPKATFEGAVLSTKWTVDRIMSDVWADMLHVSVWDGTRIADVVVAGDGRVWGVAELDATETVTAAAAAWTAARAAEAAAREREASIDRSIGFARALAVGKDVTVVKGRKVKVGSTGRIFWFGSTKFGTRVGLELTTGERIFTAATNVEVSNPDDHLDIEDLMARRTA